MGYLIAFLTNGLVKRSSEQFFVFAIGLLFEGILLMPLSLCWSGHVSSSLWSNVSKVTSLLHKSFGLLFEGVLWMPMPDYKSDNWEPHHMKIFVTWQLRVILDSIPKSCDVFFHFVLCSKNYTIGLWQVGVNIIILLFTVIFTGTFAGLLAEIRRH